MLQRPKNRETDAHRTGMSATTKRSDYHKNRLNPLKPTVLTPLPERPLVSVLMSNYNYASYLGDAIESVLGQTYESLELVICDDGSTDTSPGILERYHARDSRIKAIRQPHGGQSLALNAAFRNSVGNIICLLDADDTFMPDKVRRVVHALAAAPDSGLAVNAMLLVDASRNYLGEIPFLHELPSGWMGSSLCLTAPQFLAAIPPSSGLSLHRSVAEAIFPLPSRLTANSDGVIQLLAPMMTAIVAIPAPLSEYRIHGHNTTAVPKFREEHLRKLEIWHNEIWRVWRQYMVASLHRLGQDFSLPPETAQTPMAYAYARFRSDPRSKAIYRAIPRGYFESMPALYRRFWQTAAWMPHWLFRRCFAFVHEQNRTKLALGRILAVVRNRLGDYDESLAHRSANR